MSWKWNIVLLVIILLLIGALVVKREMKKEQLSEVVVSDSWRYVALGDSYTIGEGVEENERWPNKLVDRLKQDGVNIQLVGNPSKTGWTSQDVIDKELTVVAMTKANFVSVQIGVNDFVQGVPHELFRVNLEKILDSLKEKKVILVTIPDFSKTPTGKSIGKQEDILAGITTFNAIIVDEAKKRRIPVADVFLVSQKAQKEADLIANDGLHPSGKQYEQWLEVIYPMVRDILN